MLNKRLKKCKFIPIDGQKKVPNWIYHWPDYST